MKKIVLAVLFAMLALPAFAAAPDLSIGSASSYAGNMIAILVTADFSIPVGSSQFTVTYDPNLLTIGNVVVGTANSGWTILDNTKTPGTVIVGMFSTTGTPISGTGQVIATIDFTVNATPGTPTLASPNLILSGAMFDNNTITTLTNGNFTLNLLGDVNGDGKVTIADATLTLQGVLGITTLTAAQQAAAEVDGNSKPDVYDAFMIAEYVAGVINKL